MILFEFSIWSIYFIFINWKEESLLSEKEIVSNFYAVCFVCLFASLSLTQKEIVEGCSTTPVFRLEENGSKEKSRVFLRLRVKKIKGWRYWLVDLCIGKLNRIRMRKWVECLVQLDGGLNGGGEACRQRRCIHDNSCTKYLEMQYCSWLWEAGGGQLKEGNTILWLCTVRNLQVEVRGSRNTPWNI